MMVITRSTADQSTTVARLVAAVERRGVPIAARFDHAGAARQAGLELAGVEVVVFGNPKVGTPLMRADPRVGIELPLRVLVWTEDGPNALVGYTDPRDLAAGHDLAGHEDTLATMANLLAAVAREAAQA